MKNGKHQPLPPSLAALAALPSLTVTDEECFGYVEEPEPVGDEPLDDITITVTKPVLPDNVAHNATQIPKETPKQADDPIKSEPVWQLAYGKGRFDRAPRSLRHCGLNRSLADLLAFLLDMHYYAKRKGLDINGWFYCKARKVLKSTGIPARTQVRNFQVLASKGLLELSKSDATGMRYVKLNMEQVAALLKLGDENLRKAR